MILPISNYVKSILLENCTSVKERNELISLEDAVEQRVDNVMIMKLYELALAKSNIDFDTIPDSKGDITKYSGYTNMVECLDIIKSLVDKSNTKIPEIDIVQTAINNIILFRGQFTKGFLMDKEMVILTYNVLVLACMEATSTIMASYVDYVKTPESIEFVIRKTPTGRREYGHTSIESLAKFNASVKSSDFSKVINTLVASKDSLIGEELIIPAIIIGSLTMIVPLLRELTYTFYYARLRVSDYLKYQSMLLDIHKEEVKNSKLPPSKKRLVLSKQEKVAKQMTNIADKIAVNAVMSDKQAKAVIKSENKTLTFANAQHDAGSMDDNAGFIL